MMEFFPSPAVVVDLDVVERNIKNMVEGLQKAGVRHRPHIKPHKSIELARLQQDLGANGITCAKLGEAEVMAAGGIKDILVAFPLLGKEKLQRLQRLMNYADVTTIVNSVPCAEGLSAAGLETGRPIPVLIEVDGGGRRGGLMPGQPTVDFANAIRGLPGIAICGIMYYSAEGYGCNTWEKVKESARDERDKAVSTAGLLKNAGFDVRIISGGSSFSGKCPEEMQGITEVRSGNYIFNDCAQLANGFVTPADCALTVYTTVIACPSPNEAIIDAGSKTLTSDLCGFREGHGFIVGRPEIMVAKLNEEHGFLHSDTPTGLTIGDRISIIPNHACVVPNLTEQLYAVRGQQFSHMISVDARGRNQ